MPRSIRSLFCLALAAVVLSGCGGSRSRLKVGNTDEGEVVEAEGLTPYNAKDLIATKRASLVDAQRNAVEKAVGVYVSGKTLVEKAVAIENNILARSDGYIRKFDVLSEGPQGDLYRTRIRALVALKSLESDLKSMSLLQAPELKRPRVTIALTEKIDKSTVEEAVASTAMERAMTKAGFVVVSADRAREADIRITGQASAFPFQAEGLGGFVSYRARLSLQAARSGTKDVVVSLTREASGLGGNAELAGLKSLETVGELAGEELGPQLTEAWSQGKNLFVMVEDVPSFAAVDRVRKHLSGQAGVSDLALRLFDEQTAQFDVQLGSISADELAAALEKSQTLGMAVLEVGPQTLRLKLK